ncbi:MAG: hypothetical protein K6E34_03535 [Lachnospiraceae bacterium]|nr:hypothetical protein [Lachnospiraceae bacterium]
MKRKPDNKCTVFILLITALIGASFSGCSKSEDTASVTVDRPADEEVSDTKPEEDVSEQTQNTGIPDPDNAASDNKAEDEEGEIPESTPSDEEYKDKIDQLRKTDAVNPPEAELMSEMAALATFSRVLDEEGEIFSEMDNNKKARLRRQIFDGIAWEESDFFEAIPAMRGEDYGADRVFSVEDAAALFKDIYGEENYTPAEYEQVKDGYILFSYGDGDPWDRIEHQEFFEDDSCYLLSGPSFYEDNGGNISFKGYGDILFAKNPDSRYGVTMVYGIYRPDGIQVSRVETSSVLPPSAGKNYNGENLLDDDPATVWAEGVPGTGVGETITLYLDRKQPVYGVQIVNGYTADYTLYSNNGKLTDARVDFGGGNIVDGVLDGYGYETFSAENLADSNRSKIELDEPVLTDTITITITGANSGAKYDDTCVSGILVY